jgi:hypothetical protein
MHGGSIVIDSGFQSSNTAFGSHVGSNGNPITFVWAPGTSTKWALSKQLQLKSTPSSHLDENSDVKTIPMHFFDQRAAPNDRYRGTARAMQASPDGKMGGAISSSGGTVLHSYLFGGSTGTVQDVVALLL